MKRAVVIGAGVMGSGIAALLAGVGLKTYLLDIVPRELTAEEKAKGLTLQDRAVRNRIALGALERLKAAKPPILFDQADLELITPGNIEDNLDWLGQADWIVEAVFERLDIKRDLFAKIESHRAPESIVSSNTSGIPLRAILEGFSPELQKHTLITHFFNPPRYMKLLELVPGERTDPAIVQFMQDYCDRTLGKGVVLAKDTPNFIGNRIGVFSIMHLIRTMVQEGYRPEDVDKIFGPALGRPRSAVFRTVDLVGLDVIADVTKNMFERLPNDPQREFYRLPEFMQRMIAQGLLGRKTGKGFYKAVEKDGGKVYHVFDYKTLDYRPQEESEYESLVRAKGIKDVRERVKAVAFAEDPAGRLAWKSLAAMICYAANLVPEISDTIYAVDNAMKWGFNWELGPFETWDALGVRETAERLEREGQQVPKLVQDLLKVGESFYKRADSKRLYFDLSGSYRELPQPAGVLILSDLKQAKALVKENKGAALLDLGDGVACLEFRTRMNTIDQDVINMIYTALEEVRRNFLGLVIGNEGEHFSAGANVMLILGVAQARDWQGLDRVVKQFQDANMAIKYFEKPVVAAPFGMTLGGGAEITMAAPRARAHIELYMGQVEFGVGLIPGGGGSKEVLIRAMEGIPPGANVDLLPFVQRAFETIALARVSTSAKDAKRLGFLRVDDGITMNRDRLLADAKAEVLKMHQLGFMPPQTRKIKVLGRNGYGALLMGIKNYEWGNYITEHEALMARKLARVMTGGDLPEGAEVSEQHLLDLEREAFLSLCGTTKTQERIQHFLSTGKTLRN
ncbi:MAG: 3-hydroxyacyl-CoA dehydrogenase/enoyl-CoA hydratase family protein [Candidatus Acetothermia bacterium]|jgi:3-hydroxyacyl-CoA dehydrogenase|nr:3-hydroxyacyl-CoA dehydrogenase/enoyl-CoA hydratase family protein [Candidatus Acetothermia bacterium]MDH7504716.1 3-hydroxyacyl-CoA dehydrogenase/enoyl-CoA hydratase family protein [Candidatus Acetothermia bacterium]